MRRRPYSVVLFDEIEKAHPDIQNILLQILEDGQLTDAMGRKADFRNTIVLLTSNLGARFLAGQSTPLGFAAGSEAVFEKQSAQAIEEAKKWFRPELAGRLDEMIVFRPLADDSLCAIAEKMLCQLEQRAARSGYQLHHTPRVGQALAAKARSAYGARELRRAVERHWLPGLDRPTARGSCAVRWTGQWSRHLRIRSHPARPAWASTGQRTARRMVLSSCGRTKPQHCKASEAQKDRPELQDPGRYFFVCRGRAETSAPFLCVRGRDIVRLALASFWFSVIIEATELQEEVHAHIISFEPNCR